MFNLIIISNNAIDWKLINLPTKEPIKKIIWINKLKLFIAIAEYGDNNLIRISKKKVNIDYLTVPNIQLFRYSKSREKIHKILKISYDNLKNKITKK